MTASPWMRRLLLLGFGACGALALPPLHLVFLLMPAFAGLLWAIDLCRTLRTAFMAGWWFGLGFGLVGYYWVGSAFLVDAARYGFLAPVAVAGLAAGLAVFPGMVAAMLHGIAQWRRPTTLGMILLLAVLWGISEWLRSWVLTGFPWNLMATVWTFSPEMIQAAAYVGPYVLGAISIAVAALPALFLFGQGRRRSGRAVGVGMMILAALWAAGHARLQASPAGAVDGVRLRLVQPNIPQHLKWKTDLRPAHVRKQMRMSMAPPAASVPPPTHVIWAETSVPYDLAADARLRAAMTAAVPADGLLIAGAPRTATGADGRPAAYNSIHAIDKDSAVVATYDKKHLVPFGEYVPFRRVLRFSKLTAGRVDFHPGTTPRVMDLPGLPRLAALICYEVIFPAEAGAFAERPAWILNLTNDAWFGVTSGPHQHLAAAQLRAVELGLPVVRVANTGISAVIDGHGRIEARLPLGDEGVLDSTLPAAVASPPPYGRFGDSLSFVLLMIAAGAGLARRRKAIGPV